MQKIVVAYLFVRIEMEPALSALLLWPAVPGDRERLQPPVREFDQILLQRIEAERVLDLERRELSVRPVGLDKKFAVLAEEARAHAVIIDMRIVEIAEHGRVGRVIHRVLVLRRAPVLRFSPMTAGAGLAADEGGGRCSGRCGRRHNGVIGQGPPGESAGDNADDDERDGNPPARFSERNAAGTRIVILRPHPRLHVRSRIRRAPRRRASFLGFARAALHITMPATTTVCSVYRASVSCVADV